MAIPTAADLVQPEGPVEPSFFPDDAPPPDTTEGSVLHRLTRYIARAQAKVAAYPAGSVTNVDEAVRQWALYLAFDAAYLGMATRPMMENAQVPVLGTTAYGGQQLTELRALREKYRLGFEALLIEEPIADPNAIVSAPVRTVFQW